MNAYTGCGGTAPIILNHGTRWEWSGSRYPLRSRLGGFQSRYGHSVEGKTQQTQPGFFPLRIHFYDFLMPRASRQCCCGQQACRLKHFTFWAMWVNSRGRLSPASRVTGVHVGPPWTGGSVPRWGDFSLYKASVPTQGPTYPPIQLAPRTLPPLRYIGPI